MEAVIMDSQKSNKQSSMRILLISLAVLLVALLVVFALQYSTIRKAQDVIISGMLEITDNYNDIKDDRGKMIARLHDNFTNGCSTGGYESAMSIAMTKRFQALRDAASTLLDAAGYGNKDVTTWLSYGSFGHYCTNAGLPFLVIILALSAALGVTTVFYLKDNKNSRRS